MNEEAWDSALATLREDQRRLLADLQRLERRIEQLAGQRPASASAVASSITAEFLAENAPPPAPAISSSVPPPLPHPVADAPAPTPTLHLAAPPPLPPPPARPAAINLAAIPAPPPAPAPATTPAADSLEMRVGSYWLVRVGVAILLTGLVFLATYLYQTITPRLGPAGKIGLLYVASGGLFALGGWLTRRAREPRMRNFAAVVEAGGLAAVFFTTYAAHYFPGLQVIASPLVAVSLLLAWSAFIIWLSDRRKSPTLAGGAIALMGYTTAIHPMGTFTMFANLAVVVAAVGLMWRHRWSLVSYAAMAACYGGFFYWRFAQTSPWSTRGDFWIQFVFLAAYWVLFALAGFFGTEKEMPARQRAFLTGLNNSAFFALATLLVVEFDRPHFWRFAVVFGAVLLALGAYSHRRVDAATAGVYRMQGLLLITLAIVTYFSGWQLGLMLALQTLVLTGAASWRCSRVLLLAALLAGALAAVAMLDVIGGRREVAVFLPAAASGALLLGAAWVARHRPRGETPEMYPSWFRFASGVFSVLGPLIWFYAMMDRVESPVLAPALAIVAVALTLATGPARLPLLPTLGLLWLVAAVVCWFGHHGALSLPVAVKHRAPWWSPAVIFGASILLARWWKSGAADEFGARSFLGSTISRALCAVWGVIILAAAVWPYCAPEVWLLVAPLLAVGVVLLARLLHDEVLGLCSQILVFAGAAALMHAYFAPPLPRAGIALIASLAPIAFATFGKRYAGALAAGAQKTIADSVIFYEVLSILLVVVWIFQYLTPAWQPLALVSAGVLAVVANRLEASIRPFYFVAFAVIALAAFWWNQTGPDRTALQHLGALLVLGLSFEWARRQGEVDEIPANPLRALLLVALTLSAWRWVSLLVWERGGFLLSGAWAIFAAVLLAIGLATRERVYRLAGFAILAITLGRVLIYDTWKLGSGYRVVSFMLLGAVLMAIGFLYNRYQDKLKEWL